MKIANPIYDIVFKYLMEDERIARTILSALLKVDVVAVEVRPHEYSDDNRDTLSVFRIDFGATIRDGSGKEKLILIELQKTWLETETLRFRQYLGVHYSNPKNMQNDGNALPMVAVYLLGHKVGNIEEPVLYVNHQSLDYDGNVVTVGLPDPFVDSLTHNSIIVQIPRLHGHINNRLDMVLSIFDQTRKDEEDGRLLSIDDRAYKGDADMERILHRLTMAAADTDMRHRMNVEDEYFSAIEKRDTEILVREHKIAEQKTQLAEQKSQLAEQKSQLAEQKSQLAEQKSQLAEQKSQLAEQKSQLVEQKSQLAEQEDMLRNMIKLLLDAGKSISEIAKSLDKDPEVVKRLSI
ncbi:MAG: hypothetical protein II404_09070 [Prevotella sp.]|nr:hypothetical protein [Prevotella sp.]